MVRRREKVNGEGAEVVEWEEKVHDEEGQEKV
jgi:hypothetical protein